MFYRSLGVNRSVQAMARGGKATTPAGDYVYWRTIWDKLEVPTASSGATTTRPTACHLVNQTFWVHGQALHKRNNKRAIRTSALRQAKLLPPNPPLRRSRPNLPPAKRTDSLRVRAR